MNDRVAPTTNRSLWRAVIVQAIDDATSNSALGARSTGAIAAAKKEALDWLLKPNRDFEEVCGLAALEPDQVRALAKQRIDEANAGARRRTCGTPRPITHAGETHSIAEWSRRTGIRAATILDRLRNGATPEEALRPVQIESRAKRYTLNGESLTMKQWAERTGVPYATIASRLTSGWPLEDALTRPAYQKPKPTRASKITLGGGGRELSSARGDRRGEASSTFSQNREFA